MSYYLLTVHSLHKWLSSFKNMSDKEWDQIVEVHLKGAFSCTKAAWPVFRKQKFGRVINTSSAAGLYGVHQLCHLISVVDIPMNDR